MKTVSRSSLFTLAALLLGASSLLASEPTTDRSVQVVSAVTPAYPYLMRRAEASAEVTVSFTVNAKGLVTKATVLNSSNSAFNAATLDAIRKCTFTPAIKNGQPVESKVQQTFTFDVHDMSKTRGTPMMVAEKNAR